MITAERDISRQGLTITKFMRFIFKQPHTATKHFLKACLFKFKRFLD